MTSPTGRHSELHASAVFDAIPFGLLVIGPDDTVLDANTAALRALGQADRSDVVDRKVDEVLDLASLTEDFAHLVEANRVEANRVEASRQTLDLATLASGGLVRRRIRQPLPDGELRWLSITISFDDGGAEPHAIITVEDVSERQAEDEARTGADAIRAQLVEQLDLANESLGRSNDELQRFAGAVAHDLKNPLSVISGFASILPSVLANRSPDVDDMLDRIVRNADRASTMVEDLLSYARVVGTSAERSPVDLNAVVDSVTARQRDVLLGADATVTVAELPRVLGTPASYGQVFDNLISNAIKYRSANISPRIVISADSQTPREGFDGGMATVHVTDNGGGIPESERHAIFNLGHRGEDASRVQGSGIGLASCRAVIESVGGRIRAIDAPSGHGTTFELTLPLAPSLERDDNSGPGVTVMIVDDDPDVAYMIELYARRHQIAVVEAAETAEEAIACYRSCYPCPTVVFTDLRLPGADGLELATWIMEDTPSQQIVLHSSHVTDELRAKARAVGIAMCINKGEPKGIIDAITALG